MQEQTVDRANPRSSWTRRIWWFSVAGMATLSTIRLIIGVMDAPEGSELRYGLVAVLGIVTGVAVVLLVTFIFWIPSHIRVQQILAEAPNAPTVNVASLADDANAVLTRLGANYSFPKPRNAMISFGATPAGLVVYRRFHHRIAFYHADRIEDVVLEQRTLASGPEREVMSFLIHDEDGTIHRLSLSIFSPGKLYMIAYSKTYMQNLLSEFRGVLGVKDRAA